MLVILELPGERLDDSIFEFLFAQLGSLILRHRAVHRHITPTNALYLLAPAESSRSVLDILEKNSISYWTFKSDHPGVLSTLSSPIHFLPHCRFVISWATW